MKETTISAERLEQLEKLEAVAKKSEARSKAYRVRRNAKIAIMLRKANEMNITVSDEEIDDYLS